MHTGYDVIMIMMYFKVDKKTLFFFFFYVDIFLLLMFLSMLIRSFSRYEGEAKRFSSFGFLALVQRV